jgi:EmrB/QacA subfamily drug resistance transporter
MSSMSSQSRNVAFIVAAASFMQMLDGVIIATALPDMAQSFGVRPLELSIGVTIYMLTVAMFIPIAGWLADRFGARRVFLAAIVIFTLASIACGLSQNLTQFVVARAVQGVGGAFMVPVGRIIVLRNASKSDLIQAIALITWPALIAPVIGPALGGFITTYFSWQWNFFVNIPLGLAGFILVALFVPKTDERVERPMDWLGFLLSSGGLGCLLYGLDCLVHAGSNPVISAALVGIGLVLSALAVRHMLRSEAPLLDLSAFRLKTFAMSNLFAGSYFRMAINATPFLLPLLFQIGFGLDPLQSGALTIAYFAGNLGMKTLSTSILRGFGFRKVLVVNGVLGAISIALCAALSPQTPYPVMIAILVIAGLTRSMQFTALNTLGFADIEADQRSSASTLSSMLQQVAVVMGVALAAASLNVSQTLNGRNALDLLDFRITFLATGALALAASVLIVRLPRDAGAEISGHQSAVPAQ